MNEFKNATYKLIEKIKRINERVVQHSIHPQDAAKEIDRLLAEFAETQ